MLMMSTRTAIWVERCIWFVFAGGLLVVFNVQDVWHFAAVLLALTAVSLAAYWRCVCEDKEK